MGWFSDIVNTVTDIIPGAISGLGDVAEWTGERTGLKPLEKAGEWTHGAMNTGAGKTITNLLAAIAAPYAMPYMASMMPTSWASSMPAWMTGTTAATEGAGAAGASGSILSA